MSNIVTALKAEIVRIARREIKAEKNALKNVLAKYRSDIASLKPQLAFLQKELKRAARTIGSQESTTEEDAPQMGHRFSAKRFVSQRNRLGLSAGALGKLIGVSGLSIYNWEGDKAKPRAQHMPAIAALGHLGEKTLQRFWRAVSDHAVSSPCAAQPG